MSRFLVYFSLTILLFAMAGCQSGAQSKTTQTPIGVSQPISVLNQPVSALQEPSPLPTPIPFAPPSPLPVPTRKKSIQLNLDCTQEEQSIKCHDPILRMTFEYPAEWGEIRAGFGEGGYSGYAYGYGFQNENSEQTAGIRAGGRSRDYSEGRGGIITDFKGLDFPDEPCQIDWPYHSTIVCYEIKPGVIFEVRASPGEHVCYPGPGVAGGAISVIKIDLPTNSKINGFLFADRFLSDELENALYGILETDQGGQFTNCTEESYAEYDRKILEIRDMITSGNLDSESEANLNELLDLAGSIVFD